MIQFEQYRYHDLTLENIAERLEKQKDLPFVSGPDLTAFIGGGQYPCEITLEDVEVDKIIAANAVDSWGDTNKTHGYIIKMINAIKTGRIDLKNKRPRLEEWDGIYGIELDGTHRCIIAKLVGATTIPAVVIHRKIQETLTVRPDDYYELIRRRDLGLWRGNFTKIIPSIPRRESIYAVANIDSYQGVWVFSNNMERVKSICQKVGAIRK